MATTPYTEEDKKLLACLPKCQEQLRKQIDVPLRLGAQTLFRAVLYP